MIPSILVLLPVLALAAGQGAVPAVPEDPRPEKRTGARGEVPGALVFETPPQATFEDVHQGAVVERRFTLRNNGPATVRIERGIALHAQGTVEADPTTVPGGGRVEVRVRQPVGDRLGRAAFRFALVTDEPGVARYRLGLTGFVESAYDPEAPALDWGAAERGTTRTVEAEVFSREVEALRVLDVGNVPPFLRVDASARAGLNGEGVRLQATLDTRQAPLGVTHGVLRLRTNVPGQPECPVSYSFNVRGDVVPSRDALNLGLVREGEEATGELTLTSRSGRAVDVTAIESPDVPVTTEVVPCAGDAAGPACRALRIKYKSAERGPFTGRLMVRVAGLEEPLRLLVSGVVISPQARVKEIDLAHQDDADEAPMSMAPAPTETPAPSVPAAPVAASPPAPSPTSVTLQWKARNESGIYGYLVYRGDRPSGPFVRVNTRIIPAVGRTGEVESYAFVDDGVQPQRTYYYYLDAVDTAGLKKRFTEVKARQVGPPR